MTLTYSDLLVLHYAAASSGCPLSRLSLLAILSWSIVHLCTFSLKFEKTLKTVYTNENDELYISNDQRSRSRNHANHGTVFLLQNYSLFNWRQRTVSMHVCIGKVDREINHRFGISIALTTAQLPAETAGWSVLLLVYDAQWNCTRRSKIGRSNLLFISGRRLPFAELLRFAQFLFSHSNSMVQICM